MSTLYSDHSWTRFQRCWTSRTHPWHSSKHPGCYGDSGESDGGEWVSAWDIVCVQHTSFFRLDIQLEDKTKYQDMELFKDKDIAMELRLAAVRYSIFNTICPLTHKLYPQSSLVWPRHKGMLSTKVGILNNSSSECLNSIVSSLVSYTHSSTLSFAAFWMPSTLG